MHPPQTPPPPYFFFSSSFSQAAAEAHAAAEEERKSIAAQLATLEQQSGPLESQLQKADAAYQYAKYVFACVVVWLFVCVWCVCVGGGDVSTCQALFFVGFVWVLCGFCVGVMCCVCICCVCICCVCICCVYMYQYAQYIVVVCVLHHVATQQHHSHSQYPTCHPTPYIPPHYTLHTTTLPPPTPLHRAAAADATKELHSLTTRLPTLEKQRTRTQQQSQQLLDKRNDLEKQIQALRAEMATEFGGQLSAKEQQTLQTLNMQVQQLGGEVSAVEAAHADAQALVAQLEEQLEGTLRGALREAMQQEDAGVLRYVGCVCMDCGLVGCVCRRMHTPCPPNTRNIQTHTFPTTHTPSPSPHSTQLHDAQQALQTAAAALQAASTETTRLSELLVETEQRQGVLKEQLEGLRDALAKEAQLEQVCICLCVCV